MDNKQFIEEIKKALPGKVLDVVEHNPLRITFSIDPGVLKRAAEFIFVEKQFRFIIASASHTKEGYEILYHFSNDGAGHVINLRVVLPHEKPEVKSLTGLLSGVEWIEREMHELLGIDFIGHPNLVPLISEGNWPKGTYPFRKDFKS